MGETAVVTVDPAAHRSLAVEANNTTWEFLSKPLGSLSPDEQEEIDRKSTRLNSSHT